MKMTLRITTAILFSFLLVKGSSVFAQKELKKVEPMFWWVGMADPNLQLLVYGKDLADTKVELNYPGVTLVSVSQVENPNYLFLDLLIDESAKAGKFDINFLYGKKGKLTYQYELKGREGRKGRIQGLDPSDVMYLVMPDRFANGNPENDDMPGMLEKSNRSFKGGKHGGDLKGISDHLDYIKDLGFTTIWLNPFLENNNKAWSYHGYAITDFYNSDPRYGSNQDYKALVAKTHSMKMKVVMDMVFNHCGIGHWWTNDLPMKSWFNQHPEYFKTNFKAEVITDPHASEADRYKMTSGWFDTNMPDLNQSNPFLATYLIQNSIWWIEYSGIDGIRMDTYPYPYKEMMANWTKRVLTEYPGFYLVGETWIGNPMRLAYWANGVQGYDQYQSGLSSISDFPLFYAIEDAFSKSNTVFPLWDVLTLDFNYTQPQQNKIFADNHDTDRLFHTVGKDLDKFKLAFSYLLTTRGIPQLLYGTEILMDGHGDHGDIRADFPGGWAGDAKNAFTAEGRTEQQNEAFNFLRALLRWRQTSKAISQGKLVHFVPEDDVYVYFRILDEEVVMTLLNFSKEDKVVNLDRFKECLKHSKFGKNVLTNHEISWTNELVAPAMTPLVIDITEM